MKVTRSRSKLLSAMGQDTDAEWYGMQLMKTARLSSGTLYPNLRAFEEAGIVTSRWENIDPVKEGRPERRLYRLTGKGVPVALAAAAGERPDLRFA